MMTVRRKWWLGAALLLCLVPSSFAGKPHKCDKNGPDWKCQKVPEGGSAAIYLLGAGITCLGAMFIRSRASKRSLS
jgi:hypothetical protein